jgi:hypothetical protein
VIEGARRAGSSSPRSIAPRSRPVALLAPAQVSGATTIYRTLADPPTSTRARPRPGRYRCSHSDPLDANRPGWPARTIPRAAGSTWSGLSSHARLADTLPHAKVPTLIAPDRRHRDPHPAGARDRRAGSDDVRYEAIRAPHYLEGHRPKAIPLVADWLATRYPKS